MAETVEQLPSIDEQYILSLKQEHQEEQEQQEPNLPRRFLFEGPREHYLYTGLPLYKASSKGDWKAAKAILDERPELIRYSITENGETALHIAASAKRSKKVEEFVENLVALMTEDDLALENENFNTAFYLAAASGNVETIKIMLKKNRTLLTIPGAMGTMMPLYAAALFGNYDVVNYLYEYSNNFRDDGWIYMDGSRLLERCVENDMFDVALQIVKKNPELLDPEIVLRVLARKTGVFSETKYNIIQRTINWGKHLYSMKFITYQPFQNEYPEPGSGTLPGELARKPKVLPVTKSNIIGRTINSVFAFIGSKVRAPDKESEALSFLRIIWENIVKMSKYEIDSILRGPPDSNKQDKSVDGRIVQVMQLQQLISENLDGMKAEIMNIMRDQPNSTKQDTNPAFRKVDQALKLTNLYKCLVIMHDETQNIIKGAPDSIKQDNKPISGKVDQALELQKLVSEHIVNMHHETQNIIEIIRKGDLAPQILRVIYKKIDRMHTETQKLIRRSAKETYSFRIMFVAAEFGNTNFLVELIRRYPDLIWKVNDNNQTIFHIAVKNRHEGIYNLLYEIGTMKDLVTPLRDTDDNNMLHLAGKTTQKKRLEDVSGAALQMQRELLWFKEVESIIPPSYREQENNNGLTPRELFSEEHKDLITQGEKWMKETANQCMIVAALIATIVFAAAFTVPGGYNQDNGIPIFYRKLTFVVFVVSDAISLFLSSASILTFLSILTSRYAERDFMESLPKKLMLGLAALFLSIATMVVTFSVSFFILYHQEMKWIPILISVFAIIPVLLYVALQYHLLVDVIRSTYGPKYLFKPSNQVLFYENPKF